MKKLKSFINDRDGFSARDFLMVSFVGVFLLQQIVLFILSIVGEINPTSISIMESLDAIIMTIVGGVFAVQGVREFKNKADGSSKEVEMTYAKDIEKHEENMY